MEGFKFEAPKAEENIKDLLTPDEETLRMQEQCASGTEGVDFSMFLGEGFDAEYFSNKIGMFEKAKTFELWNEHLEEAEGGNYRERTIEFSKLDQFFEKLTGAAKAPMMFPVFIKAIKDIYAKRGVPDDHVTPEFMEEFYNKLAEQA